MANEPRLPSLDVLHLAQAQGEDALVTARRQAAVVEQVCSQLVHEVAALTNLVTDLVERPAPARLAVSVEEAADMIGVGRSTMFALLESGEVRSVKVGTRRLVPVRALEEFVGQSGSQQVG
jgi:excisionase family DNA binding protein